MIYIGNHVSSSKGYEAMGKQEVALGGDTFAFFTRNPRGGSAKEIKDEDVQRLLTLMKDHSFGPLVAHAPYTMNVCAAKEDIRKFSVEMLKDDIRRMEYLPGAFYNFHPGSHVGAGVDAGINQIVKGINNVLTKDSKACIALETMAGKGSEIGRNFEELARIYDGVVYNDKLRVCFDTCHTSDSGYDIIHHFDDVIETILMGMLYSGKVETMMPKLHSQNFEGMELIRPMYLIKESAIKAWRDTNGLHFIQCACRFTENCVSCGGGRGSKRDEMKELVAQFRNTSSVIETNIFNSVRDINLRTVMGYHKDGEYYNFLDDYDQRGNKGADKEKE